MGRKQALLIWGRGVACLLQSSVLFDISVSIAIRTLEDLTIILPDIGHFALIGRNGKPSFSFPEVIEQHAGLARAGTFLNTADIVAR
jgi:hypothetical protein